MKQLFLGILLGILAHKVVYEYANIRAITDYTACLKNDVVHGLPKSPFQQCKHHLEHNQFEKIVLYQPNLWELYAR